MSSRAIPEDHFGNFLGFDSDSIASIYNSRHPLYEQYVDVVNISVNRAINTRDGRGYNMQVPGKYWVATTASAWCDSLASNETIRHALVIDVPQFSVHDVAFFLPSQRLL